jgi:hypothetical protein
VMPALDTPTIKAPSAAQIHCRGSVIIEVVECSASAISRCLSRAFQLSV